jgi:hypothetical protein
VAVLAVLAIPATGAGAQSFSHATKVTAPSDAGTDAHAFLFGVSCTSAGNCAAVGHYVDTSSHSQAMTATETSGTWARATKVTAPSDAGTDAHAFLFGVSCTSAGNCAAAGLYHDASSHSQAMSATETSGTWAQATKVTAPTDAGTDPAAILVGVSCTSAGNCAGVGQYTDASSHSQAMTATETSGTWAQAIKVTAPTDAGTDPAAELFAVSCTSAGNCAAVGQYTDASSHSQAMAATETSGTWAPATKVTAPTDAGTEPAAILVGVSCTSAGNCAAVGRYGDNSTPTTHQQAMSATETSKTWAQATKVTAPTHAGTNPGAILAGVSCTSAGSCAGVGSYEDSSSHGQAMAVSESKAPTSTDQCKKGGWADYPALGFKNQGDCVSYVATHGKNPPG